MNTEHPDLAGLLEPTPEEQQLIELLAKFAAVTEGLDPLRTAASVSEFSLDAIAEQSAALAAWMDAFATVLSYRR